ncbi:hypothetical protein SAMN02927924_01437 [Sphingobium faniae]|nr:hypothetical protein SAMN02927924_01437 [Sphingobium faniae]
MATQYRDGQRLQGSDGNVYVVRNGVPTLEQAQSVPGGIVVKPADPTLGSKVAKAANDAAASVFDPQRAATSTAQGQYDLRTQPTKDNINLTGDLAKRYTSDPAVKQYAAAIQSYARAVGAKDTPQGDLSLIYAYAKIMDPDSVVREGEAASVSNSDTLAGQLVARYRKELGEGGVFSATARQNLLQEMRNAMGALNASYVQARQTYGQIAQQNGLDEKQVIGPHAGLPFSKREARMRGTSEPQRDFYGNVTEPARPIGGIPEPDQIDPTGGNPLLSPQDRAEIAANARYMTPESMQAWFRDRGLQISPDEARRNYDYYSRGGSQDAAVNAPQGEGSLLGRLAGSTPGMAVGGYLNGALMGGMDEVAAGIGSAINGTPYSENLREANAKKQAIASDSPLAYGTGNVIGGITGAIGLGALGIGSRLPILTDIGLGALGGALEENDNRSGGAALGGAFGGATGGVLRGLAALPGRPAGVDLPIAQNVERAGVDNVRGSLMEARDLGIPMSLADTNSIMSTLAGSATRLSPQAEEIAIGSMVPRARGQIDRFGEAIERDLGPLANPMEQSEALLQKARRDAAPLYERAYEMPVIGTSDLDAILNTPFGRQALGKARNIAANERRSPEAMGLRMDADGNVVLEPTVPMTLTNAGSEGGNAVQQMGYTMQALDQTKQGMDDVLEQYRNPVTGKLDLTPAGVAENGVRADLLNQLDELNPTYAEARRAYQGPMELRDALATGRDAVRRTPREVQAISGRMSPAEQQQMQLGYRVGLDDRANDIRYSSNPFEGVLGPPAAEQRLSAVYGDNNPGVTRLLRQRDIERQLAGSTNDVLGNSKTAKRILADESFMNGIPGGIIDVGADLATGNAPIGSALRALGAGALRDRAKMGAMRGAQQRADEMAPILFNTDTPAALDTLDEILARTSAYRNRQRLLQPIAGSTGGVIGGMVPGWLSGN